MNTPMIQETFIRIIKALQEQRQREEKFSQNIQQAFVEAGDYAEFHTPESFSLPTGLMVDQILEALSYGFVGENQTQEEAYNHINYFFYELEMRDYMIPETINSTGRLSLIKHVPAYYHAKDGTKLPLATPEDLYNSLVYEMTTKHPAGNQ